MNVHIFKLYNSLKIYWYVQGHQLQTMLQDDHNVKHDVCWSLFAFLYALWQEDEEAK